MRLRLSPPLAATLLHRGQHTTPRLRVCAYLAALLLAGCQSLTPPPGGADAPEQPTAGKTPPVAQTERPRVRQQAVPRGLTRGFNEGLVMPDDEDNSFDGLRADLGTFVQRGMASWYGPGFHGRKTAKGERFDMHAMTAAHPSLPLGSWVLVHNTRNSRSVVVRVTDRGPFAKRRVLDLSKAAASALGFLKQGTAHVEIRRLSRIEAAAVQQQFGDDLKPGTADDGEPVEMLAEGASAR